MTAFRAAALLLLSFTALLVAGAGSAQAQTVIAVANTAPRTVVTFDTATPGTIASSTPLLGVRASETVIGIDLNPKDGRIYLVSRDTGTSAAFVMELDPLTGITTPGVQLTADPADLTSPYTTLSGTSGDVDFNPVTGRLRVITDTHVSLRLNVANGLVTTDTNLAGADDLPAIAYGSNVASAATTTLYVLDWSSDELKTVTPPNNGTLVTVGATGFSAGTQASWGFDVSATGQAVTIGSVGGVITLYTVDLTTGAYTSAGVVGTGSVELGDFTLRPNVVSVSTPTVTVTEGGAATVHLTRSSPAAASRVDWTATAGGATAGDFTASGSGTFAAGVTELDVPIATIDDSDFESAENFVVTFTASTDPATLDGVPFVTAARSSTVTIASSDTPATPAPVTTTKTIVAPDVTKPFLFLLQAPALKRAVFLKKGVTTTTFVSEAVTDVITLRLGTTVVGTAAISSTGGTVITKRVALTKAGMALIAKSKSKRLAYTITVVTKDAAGNSTTVKRTAVLLR